MNSQNDNQNTSGQPTKLSNNPVRPNLADSSINQEKHDLDTQPDKIEKGNDQENDPEKEYIAGEKEGDFPPDIKMNQSLSEGSEFDTDAGTVGQQAVKDQQSQSKKDLNPNH